MPSSPLSTAARSTRRRTFAAETTATGLALGLITALGFTTVTPAFAAQASAGEPAFANTMQTAITSPYASPSAATLDDMTSDARTALAAARAVLVSADSVTADIHALDLDLGGPSTSIDTVTLREQMTRLETLDVVPVLLLPGRTADTADETRLVAARVAELRDRLDAAVAQKVADEAAARAAAEAQREAEAAAAAAAEAEAAAAAANTPEGAQATAARLAAANYGWGADQFSCLVSLWSKESGWNYQAYNASSGATGIPQSLPGSKMASAGADWQSNAATQIAWGLQYISAAYGTPCSAWGHSQATNWY